MTTTEQRPGRTRAQQIRDTVTALDAAGHTETHIAQTVGLTPTRVRDILELADTGTRRVTTVARTTEPDPATRTPRSRKAAPKTITPPKPPTPQRDAPTPPTTTVDPDAPRPRRQPPGAPIQHGQPGGRRKHIRRGEQPCDACRDQYNRELAAYRAARRNTR